MEVSRMKLLTKISHMYYNDGLSQQEITNTLCISRSQISRMLSEARENGIVTITINDPFSQEHAVATQLTKMFGLKDTTVVDVSKNGSIPRSSQIEQAAAELFESLVKDGDIIAVSPGKTINGIAKYLSNCKRKGCITVPASGSWGNSGDRVQGNISASLIATQLNGRALVLNAPSLVSTETAKKVLCEEPDIREVLEMARKSTKALFGVGQISRRATIFTSGTISEEIMDELLRNGACASFCSSFLNRAGKEVRYSLVNNQIGLSLDEIAAIPCKILVASGVEKKEAIQAMLAGKWADYLVTDLETALLVMKETES